MMEIELQFYSHGNLLLIVMMQRHQEDSSAFAKAFFSVFKITNLDYDR
jgi:hypothetical protein